MLNLVYAALKARLLEECNPQYLDWYMGQYLEEEAEDGGQLLWATPAQFIEFLPIQWQTLPGNVQVADLQFNVHLVNDSVFDTDARMLDTTLNHLGQEGAVFRALMNWRAMLHDVPGMDTLEGTSADRVLIESLVRTSTDPDHNLRRQLVSVQSFTSRVYDYSATKQWVQVMATLDLEVLKVLSLTP